MVVHANASYHMIDISVSLGDITQDGNVKLTRDASNVLRYVGAFGPQLFESI
jgi:hypothetical protein